MDSVDHFGQELRAQMSRAAAHGATDISINGNGLCRALRGTAASMDACSKAMRAELKAGDTVIIEAAAGVGDDCPLSVAAKRAMKRGATLSKFRSRDDLRHIRRA